VVYDVMSVARYMPTAGGSYRRGPRRYVPDIVGHDSRCMVLQNFGTIYFCKIEIEKIYIKIPIASGQLVFHLGRRANALIENTVIPLVYFLEIINF
jgi:hypothetical protein